MGQVRDCLESYDKAVCFEDISLSDVTFKFLPVPVSLPFLSKLMLEGKFEC